jgi:ribosomal protein L22
VTPPDRQRPDEGWDSLKVDELKEELEARGLPKSGTKAELVARLEESEAEAPAAAVPADEAAAEAPDAAAPADEPAAEAAPEEDDSAETPEAPNEGVAEEVVPPEEPAEEPSADEVEEAEGPEAAEDEAPEAEADEADEDEAPEAEAGEDAEGEAAPAPATRRRGSAEVSTGRRRAPRRPDGDVVVRARSKYVRSAPRKARLVMDHIRGKEVEQARAILTHAPRAVAEDILKLLNSAVANAESSFELGPDELRVRKAFVDEGPIIKRFRPRALGRATRINKRTSHMTIELTTTEG